MARPTSRRKSKLSKAVCKLRAELGDSQQAFSNRLGVALHTISRYETFAPPTGEALHKLAAVAKQHGLIQLCEFFQAQYVEEVLGELKARLLVVPGELSEPPHGFLTWDPKGERELRFAQTCNLAFGLARSAVPDTVRKIDEGFAALEVVVRECTGNPLIEGLQQIARAARTVTVDERNSNKRPKPSPRKKDR
jgi:transcriptional regulator with XRE-family HTH domain